MSDETFRRPPRSETIDIGSVVLLHSLHSETGKAANGKRALVLRHHKDLDRWECKVEKRDGTMALKETNMKIPEIEAQSHPDYMDMISWHMAMMELSPTERRHHRHRIYRSARGVTYDDDPPPHRAQKLVELLDRPDEFYTPNQTLLLGEACATYSMVGENNMSSNCSIYDLEHVGALLNLAAMCQGEKSGAIGCGDGEPEAVLFALMEAAPRSIDVLMEFMVATPYIGPPEDFTGSLESSFRKARASCDLTPDQKNAAYCLAMRGPIGLLCFLTRPEVLKIGPSALVHYLEHHKLYPLMIQRLFRIVAREKMGMQDGKDLGKLCRNILASLADVDESKLEANLLTMLCESDESVFSKDTVSKLLRQDSVSSREQLLEFLRECMDRKAADAFVRKWVAEHA